MSSILKALRRLEEERARKNHSTPEISASLLRHGTSRRSPSVVWLWPTLFALIIVILLVLVWWLWRPAPLTRQSESSVPSPANLPAVLPEKRGGVVIIEDVIDTRRPVYPQPATSPVSKPTPPPITVNPPPAQMSLQPEGKAQVEVNKLSVAPIEERKNPIVSAIAWQDDTSARMAVVDGLPVMTGELVSSAKVLEILSDRIIFEEDGVRFSVRMQTQ